MTKTLYEVLGIRKNAGARAITKAYRKRAMETHPDRGGDPEEFRQVEQAYKVLRDPARRKWYDETGEVESVSIDREESAVLTVLSSAMSAVLAELVKYCRPASSEDVLGHMRNTLEMRRDSLTKGIVDTEKTMREADEAAKRFADVNGSTMKPAVVEVKEEDGFGSCLKDVASGIRSTLERNLTGMRHEKAVNDKALDVVKRGRYRFDKKVEVHSLASMFRSGYGTAATVVNESPH